MNAIVLILVVLHFGASSNLVPMRLLERGVLDRQVGVLASKKPAALARCDSVAGLLMEFAVQEETPEHLNSPLAEFADAETEFIQAFFTRAIGVASAQHKELSDEAGTVRVTSKDWADRQSDRKLQQEWKRCRSMVQNALKGAR
ncbi:MAG: hypothetical protein HRU11_10645 [Parvularculaceae bacterium]|nr:hypothetical protein [Parvularculaceae bacterium]